ncbi:AbgT family transporter [Brevibacterium senegalense]|uniref:AbgT family transporter n=1 Tax=Brevibacterium senegalense TaxID=1033736 RepID=UPI0004746AA7|nr:AbgT family transporter [Brevibacterium senegalense]
MTSTTSTTTASADTRLSPTMRRFFRALEAIEWVGNKLPHSFWLFWILAAILAVVSAILATAGVEVTPPGTDETVAVKSMLTGEGLAMVFGTALENFAGFAPLPIIFSVIIGVAVAERSGVLSALLRLTIVRLPARWVTFSVAFAGMISHVMFDAAFIVMLPLAAMAFKAVGRSPVLGLMVAFGSISAGYNASPLVTPSDAILSSLSTEAARIVDPDYTVSPLGNYYWAIASSVVLSIAVTLVVEFALARRPDLDADVDAEGIEPTTQLEVTAPERRALLLAFAAFLAFAAVVVLALLPASSPLRGEDGGIIQSVVLKNIAIFIGLAFVILGVVYGCLTREFTRARQIPESMADGIRTLAPVLVLFFAISQFLAYFKWTGIGTIIAVNGASFLQTAGMPPLLLFIVAILLISVMNIIITSGSAMWSLLAPILVPMFMYLDIPPETTQLVYRIADSCTNAITPMSAYFILALSMVQRYRKSAGIGTVVSFTLPLAMTLLVTWVALFIVWYLLGLPIGPGVSIR